MKTKVLIIGGGFAGCLAAHMLEKKAFDITLIEREAYLGGGCRTFYYGGHPYTLGPRHFLTKREDVFEFLHRHCPMKRYEGHEFLTYIERDQSFFHFPIHRDEVDMMPDRDKILSELDKCFGAESARNLEEYWLMSVGPTLYDKFINSYSKKMWNIASNTEIIDFSFTPKGVALKTGPDKAAWTEAISAFPHAHDGYNQYFEIATQNAHVKLNTHIQAYDMHKKRIKIDDQWHVYDLIISSLSPEVILNNAFGKLRWSGRDFFKIVLPCKSVLPENVYFLYYANQEPFTRIVEYKKFYNYDASTTLLGLEIPSFSNKLYPYPMAVDLQRAQQYIDAMPANVYSIGRMGTYRYLDVGMIIEQCMDMVKKI
jgi:UDP-galactopyranose mutase